MSQEAGRWQKHQKQSSLIWTLRNVACRHVHTCRKMAGLQIISRVLKDLCEIKFVSKWYMGLTNDKEMWLQKSERRISQGFSSSFRIKTCLNITPYSSVLEFCWVGAVTVAVSRDRQVKHLYFPVWWGTEFVAYWICI